MRLLPVGAHVFSCERSQSSSSKSPVAPKLQEHLATAAGNVAEAESTPDLHYQPKRQSPPRRSEQSVYSAFNVIVQVILHIPALGVCVDPIALRVARAFRTNEKAPAMPGL